MAVIAADSERSLSGTTGYQELLGGGLLQWGIAGGTGDVGVTFPKVFPSACRCIMASMDSNGALPADTILVAHVDAISATGFTIRKRILNSGVISAAVQGAFWIAIGY
jgi:hypothetical protein